MESLFQENFVVTITHDVINYVLKQYAIDLSSLLNKEYEQPSLSKVSHAILSDIPNENLVHPKYTRIYDGLCKKRQELKDLEELNKQNDVHKVAGYFSSKYCPSRYNLFKMKTINRVKHYNKCTGECEAYYDYFKRGKIPAAYIPVETAADVHERNKIKEHRERVNLLETEYKKLLLEYETWKRSRLQLEIIANDISRKFCEHQYKMINKEPVYIVTRDGTKVNLETVLSIISKLSTV